MDCRLRGHVAVAFLLKLPGEADLSEEEALATYRRFELWAEPAFSLVTLGRVEELIATLSKRGDHGTLVASHHEANEVRDTVAAWKKLAASRGSSVAHHGWSAPIESLVSMVAAAAADEFPDEAIRIERDLADRLIAHRQRPAYRQAAGYLEQVKQILERTGRGPEWQEFISDPRKEHKALRALRDELDTLGLN